MKSDSIWLGFNDEDVIMVFTVATGMYGYHGRVADMPEELKHERYDYYILDGVEEANYIMLDFS